MGRRARSSVVVLNARRRVKGGADALEDYVPFNADDMEWSRLSQIFIGGSYQMRCKTGALDLDEGQACFTSIPEIKLRVNTLTHSLAFFLTEGGGQILFWDFNQGIITLREDLLKSPDYYAGSSVPNKVVNLLQWAIESIVQYYPKDKHATLQPLTKCILLDGNKKEERDMVVYLNDDVRARYKCTEVCDVSFGAPSAPSAKAKAPSAPSAKAKAPSALKSSPSKPAAPLSPSAISPFQIASTPSASKSKTKASITIALPAAPLVKAPGVKDKSSKTATQAKPSAIPLAKPSATAAKKETEKTDIPKQRWWARLFRRPVAL